MATRDEIVDQIAGFALFADLTTPQLERIAHMFEEEVFPDGARVLRQGLSGSAFYVILDGEAAVVIDGQQRATLARGDFFGEVSILLGEAPGADIVASRPLRTLVLAGPAVHGVLLDNPPLMSRMLPALAVLPAPPVMDEALRAGRARLAGLRALRLELAPLGRPGPARDHAGPHGRHVVLSIAAGDGAEHRDVRRADWDTDPLRLPLD